MEGVINSALKQHQLNNNLLCDAQFGFCYSHSAPNLITALVQMWTKELNSPGEVRMRALDVKAGLEHCSKLETEMLAREQGGALKGGGPCSQANMSVSGLLQCSSEAQRKLEEQHL
eukprot:g19456.t1